MKSLEFNYDEVKDILYINLGDDKFSNIKEVEPNLFVKRDIYTKKITSIILVGFAKGTKKEEKYKKNHLQDLLGSQIKMYAIDDIGDLFDDSKNKFFDFLNSDINRINPDEDKK